MKRIRFQSVAVLLVLVPACFAVSALAETRGAAVTGFVKDAKGIPQMGALVQALMPDATSAGMAITDLKGHYVIKNLRPGKYQVRATAALFLPSSRGDLRLRAGAQTIVNLTLTTLFEETQWLPAERRKPDESPDEWTWTLRSAANRPILRLADGDGVVLISPGPEGRRSARHTRVELVGSSDAFGRGGMRNVVTFGSVSNDGRGTLARASGGVVGGPYALGAATEGSVVYQRPIGPIGLTRTRVSYQNHPEMLAQGGVSGYQTVTMDSAEVMNFGDTAELEFGSSLRAVHMGPSAIDARPFVRLALHPSDRVVLSYQMARSRDLQGIADLDSADAPLPVAILRGDKMLLERGSHTQVSAGVKTTGKGQVKLAYYRDNIERPMVAGSSVDGTRLGLGNMMVDANTGTLRMIGDAYSSVGWDLSATQPFAPGLTAVFDLSTGDALSVAPGAAGSTLHAGRSKSAMVALKGTVASTGTQFGAGYRWQKDGTVTAVNSFNSASRQPYLSFSIRQPMRIRHFNLQNLEAFIDVTNLLEQGYRPFLSSDGRTLVLAQSPRMLQAGVAFTF